MENGYTHSIYIMAQSPKGRLVHGFHDPMVAVPSTFTLVYIDSLDWNITRHNAWDMGMGSLWHVFMSKI